MAAMTALETSCPVNSTTARELRSNCVAVASRITVMTV
jgi:hypothetical protein